jgi:serpin B
MKYLLSWLALSLATLLLAVPARAQNPPLASPPPSSALVAANTQFALDLFRQLNPAPTDNVFFSPYSISTALAMTWVGARGETASQMAQVLHLSSLTAGSIPAAFHDLQAHLNALQASGNFQLAIANSLWPQQGYPLLPAYLDLVKTAFASGIFPVDYVTNAESARLQINTWTSDQTNHKIPEIIPKKTPPVLDAATRLVLVNAIYFNGTWLTPFKPDDTSPQPFHLANGASTDVPIMSHYFDVGEAPPYASVPLPGAPGNLQILSLPYKGEALSLVVLLPPTPDSLPSLIKNLTASQLAAWLAQLGSAHEDLAVSLPKFKLSEGFDLARHLQALGMTDAFGAADFSGIDGLTDLVISAVLHQAYIDVNEQGTEAAAATAVVMGPTGAPPHPIYFVADHPFLFFIRDNATGSILFFGQFANPPSTAAPAKPGQLIR